MGRAHVRRNPASAAHIAKQISSAVLTACVTYAVVSLCIRVLQIVVADDARGLTAPIYDVLLAVAAAATGAIAWLRS